MATYDHLRIPITDIKSVLTQKALKIFCETFLIPDEVHPTLPSPNQTIHEMPTGKIAAKVSHFEILCRIYGFEPTVGLFCCFYVNSKNKDWMSLSKRSGVSKDPFPKPSEYDAGHYATLVAYPALFHKYPKPFLCLVGLSRYYTLDENTYPEFLHDNDQEMDLLSFIRTANPTKVKIGERHRTKGEPKLLDTIVGRVVPLLPVAPACTEGELEASVDKLFDEGGSGNQIEQGDSAAGGEDTDIQLVSKRVGTVAEDVALLQPRRQKKRKTVVISAGEPSYPSKKLREDHGTPSGTSVAGKSMPAVQRLLLGRAPQRFVISSDSSHHSGTHVADTEVDSLIRSSALTMTTITTVTATVDAATVVKETPAKPSLFAVGSSSAGGTNPTPGGFSDLTGSDFLVGGVHTVIDLDSNLQKVYVLQWSVTNGSRLDDGRICRNMVNTFAPPNFFASIREMEHDQLFTEFNVGAARQISLSTEVRMHAEYNIREKRMMKSMVDEQAEAAEAIRLRVEASKFEVVEKSLRYEAQVLKEHHITLEREKSELEVKVANLAALVKVREQEVADFDVVVTFVRSQNDNLVDQVHGLETSSARLQEKVTVYEDCMGQLERFQDERMKVVNDKFDKLYTDFVEMSLHLEERFYPHLLTTIFGHRWLLTHGIDDTLAERLGLTESQPHIDQLMVPIHHSPDQRFIGAYTLSLSLDVSSSRVWKIKDNIANHRSALHDVFVPLSEPLSITDLTGMEGTSSVIPATADTTMALSVTFASASSIHPISTDDYKVVNADG
ncbi:gypsy type transposase [Tanacetum coccineum]|uniref:Gypsy type transposase n=1 Tax=Tanacetum coccineum TaxID=301880 RepID=A0ABQ5CEW6_9ASTR